MYDCMHPYMYMDVCVVFYAYSLLGEKNWLWKINIDFGMF